MKNNPGPIEDEYVVMGLVEEDPDESEPKYKEPRLSPFMLGQILQSRGDCE